MNSYSNERKNSIDTTDILTDKVLVDAEE